MLADQLFEDLLHPTTGSSRRTPLMSSPASCDRLVTESEPSTS
jgi:hypothetical protein